MRPRRDKPPKGVRPTTAKVLESLLGILGPHLPERRCADLFAGTGEVGLRFLEEGAATVDFVEGDPAVARQLQARLFKEAPGEQRAWRVVRGQIPGSLQRLEGRYGLFWADPPYSWKQSATLLPAVAPYAAPQAILVVERHHKTAYLETAGWSVFREEKYGETRLTFFRFDQRLLVDPTG